MTVTKKLLTCDDCGKENATVRQCATQKLCDKCLRKPAFGYATSSKLEGSAA